MRRLPKGAPVGGRVCQRGVRFKRCKGEAVLGVSQSAEVRGRVRAETPGRLCSSASRRRGEPGLQRAGGDRRYSKERGWDHGISKQGDAKRRERGVHNRAAEERYKMRSLPTSALVRRTVCRRECAARSERCEACRTGRRSAAECAVRHPQVFAAAQSFRGREAADVARSGGRGMPTQLIQTVTDSAQRGEGCVGKHENETVKKVLTRFRLPEGFATWWVTVAG